LRKEELTVNTGFYPNITILVSGRAIAGEVKAG
jgi:hypothetical protein